MARPPQEDDRIPTDGDDKAGGGTSPLSGSLPALATIVVGLLVIIGLLAWAMSALHG